ncbi:restriction endonuclease subunit S [Streptomyces hirsutus]|uniref:restriction endonuclease subunit S n=1 Tax=Streptomyces hirsutus TaxID=35620 RepID=UPI0034305953
MTEWQRRKLGDLCTRITVGHVGSMASRYTESGIPFLRSLNIKRGRLDLSSLKFIDDVFHAELAKSQLAPGDLTIVRTGEPGTAALIPDGLGPMNCSDLVIATPRPEVDARFLCYAINETAQDFVKAHTVGAVQQHFNVKSAKELELSLPPLSVQRLVSGLLGALDDKIAVNERIATAYEQLLQCRFAELGLAEEPDSGSAVPVTDLVSFNPKLAKPFAEEPIYVDMAALQTHLASIPTWTRRVPKSGPRFMNGDTLLARITPCLENGKTGYVDFMEDGEVGLGSTEFIVMRSLPGVPSELSYFLARDSRFREHAIRNMVGTSGRQRVSAADAANYQVNRPDADALAAFGKEASAAFAHMKSLQAESRTLATLRDTLLPQLMSGRLRVKDAEKIVEDAT